MFFRHFSVFCIFVFSSFCVPDFCSRQFVSTRSGEVAGFQTSVLLFFFLLSPPTRPPVVLAYYYKKKFYNKYYYNNNHNHTGVSGPRYLYGPHTQISRSRDRRLRTSLPLWPAYTHLPLPERRLRTSRLLWPPIHKSSAPGTGVSKTSLLLWRPYTKSSAPGTGVSGPRYLYGFPIHKSLAARDKRPEDLAISMAPNTQTFRDRRLYVYMDNIFDRKPASSTEHDQSPRTDIEFGNVGTDCRLPRSFA